MTGLMKAGKGDILLKGHSIRNMRLERLSRMISMVYQNPEDMFIKDSIEGDISYAMQVRGLSDWKERTQKLLDIFDEYHVFVGAAHPFRNPGNIPELPYEQLKRLDFIDLNGKDIASNRYEKEEKTFKLGKALHIPVVSGSDTHQAVQYDCIRTCFDKEVNLVEELYKEMIQGWYTIDISENCAFKVQTAGLLKKALKEIHALGGDYISILVDR